MPALKMLLDKAGVQAFLQYLPATLAKTFTSDVMKVLLEKQAGSAPLKFSSLGSTALTTAIKLVGDYYIEQAMQQMAKSGSVSDVVGAGAFQYSAKVALNTVLVYVRTPSLWETGGVGLRAAIAAAIIQSTIENVVQVGVELVPR